MLIGIDAHNLEGKRTGVGRYLINLLQEWIKLNDKLQMADVKFALYFKDEIPGDLPQSALFECKLLNVGSTAKFTHWDLPRAAKKDRVNVLFCPAYVAPLCYSGKIALTLHDISYEVYHQEFNWPSPADKILLRWVSKKSAKKAAMIFTPSEFTRQEVIRHYHLLPERVIATPLAADEAFYRSALCGGNQAAAIKTKEGEIKINGKFIFYAGSIFTRRHLPEIIAAFKKIVKENSNYQFLIGGRDYTKGRVVDKLIKEINQEFGRQAILRVDFVGDDELKLIYCACAFFIWLSDYEGFGLPVLEAMSCGAPVITTDGSSLKEVAGEAALLVKNNTDVEEIYRAMKKVIEDELLRQELIIKSRAQADKFSWKECAEKTLKALADS